MPTAGLPKSYSSRYQGVSWNEQRKKWAFNIKKDGRQINLGNFSSEVAAAKAYDKAAKKYHGRFANLNFHN